MFKFYFNSNTSKLQVSSKQEHDDDVYQLIYIILENYQPIDEQDGALSEKDGFSASTLLDGDELCLEKLREWEIRTQSAIINSTGLLHYNKLLYMYDMSTLFRYCTVTR